MVRLKVIYEIIFEFISSISIPYGAIKSISDYFIDVIIIKFQFLMVRLKDVSKYSFEYYVWISIPYGAIKR